MVNETHVVDPSAMPKSSSTPGASRTSDGSFDAVLSETRATEGSVKFSAHAVQRLNERKIALSEDALARISRATDTAATKGSRESLLLLNNLGLIVNVKNRTVLTALDPQRMQEGIVTNIDSTVIIGG